MNTQPTKYYVATTGSNSGAGSLADPWQTIQWAADHAAAGDSIIVHGGTYRERVALSRSGVSARPILFTADPGETVIIDGMRADGSHITPAEFQPGPEDLWGLWDFKGQSYITVSGFHLRNAGNNGFYGDGSHPGSAARSSHLTLQQNTTYNCASSGIGIWNYDYVTVDGNEVALSNLRINPDPNVSPLEESLTISGIGYFEVKNNVVYNQRDNTYPKEGICVKDGSHNGKVYKNTIHDTRAVGLYVDAELVRTHDIEVYQNEVYNGREDGIVVATERSGPVENIKVYNNLSHHNGWNGLRIAAMNSAGPNPIHNAQVVNNTVIENGGAPAWNGAPYGGGILVETPDILNILIRNNLISQNYSFQLVLGTGDATHNAVPRNQVIIDHNLKFGNTGPAAEEVDGLNCVQGNLSSAAGPHYHLTALSPAIQQGTLNGAPAFDFDGVRRPGGNGCDIGAYTYHPAGS